MLESWSTGTQKVYETYMDQWATFCIIHRISLRSPSPFEVCRFLRLLSEKGRAFGTVNAARCALSVLVKNLDNGKTMGTHYWVCRAVRTAYRRNPPSPKYNKFWDIRLVFSMFQRWGPNEALSTQFLGFKLTMLILLVTGQRGQVIPALDLRNLTWMESGSARFVLKGLMKTARTGEPLKELVLEPFHEEETLCVVCALKRYLQVTRPFRLDKEGRRKHSLFLYYRKPFSEIGQDSSKRWVLAVLAAAGVDTRVYRAHSTRGANTSAGGRLGVSTAVLLRHGSWKGAKTMAKHYNKPIENPKPPKTLARILLEDSIE